MAARPAVRRTAARPMDAPSRPIVRDLTRGGASFRIDWDVRTAYDFVFSLSGEAGSTDDVDVISYLERVHVEMSWSARAASFEVVLEDDRRRRQVAARLELA